jgi:hypothetical protein
MNDAMLDQEDQAELLGAGAVIACPIHEPAVLRAVTGRGDVDEATLREVDEAMECPACRLLLALASGDASFVERHAVRMGSDSRHKVVPFPASPSAAASGRGRRPRHRVIVVEERLAALSDTLCVGESGSGRYQFRIRFADPDDDRKATIEVRVGHRTSIGLRWLDGFRVRLQPGGQEVGHSFLTVPAQAGRKVRHVIEEVLEPAD